MLRITIFSSFERPELFSNLLYIIDIIQDDEDPEYMDIYRKNIKIMYDRTNKKEKSQAYSLMFDLVRTQQVVFVTDTLYSKGRPLYPKDRIILETLK